MGSYYVSNPTVPVWPGYNAWPGYGYYTAPRAIPQIVYVPRVRQSPGGFEIPEAKTPNMPDSLPTQPLTQSLAQPGTQDVFQPQPPVSDEPGALSRTANSRAVKPAAPQSFAEEVGDQVGTMVTRLIEENPQWEQKLRELDIQRYLNDPGALLSGVHQTYQNTPMLKWVTRQFSNQLVKALPDQFEPVAMQMVDWLNSPLRA